MTTNPWDIPPLPKKGDTSKSSTYEAVGLALSNWEEVEFGLGLLFRTLLRADMEIGASRAYGSVITFRGRIEMIEAAAEAYFMIKRGPRVKADLSRLLNRTVKFGARRNEIAHGLVQDFKIEPRKREGFALHPSYFNSNKRSLIGTRVRRMFLNIPLRRAVIRPRYVYTSVEIRDFAAEFKKLADEIGTTTIRVSNLWLSKGARLALKHPEKLDPQTQEDIGKHLLGRARQRGWKG